MTREDKAGPRLMGWVGSKLRFADKIREHLPPVITSYAEPFAGSGSQFLRMIEVGQISPGATVTVADVPAVANLWRCVAEQDARQYLIRRLRNWADDAKTVTQTDSDDPLHAFGVAKDVINGGWQRNYAGSHIGAAAAVLALNHLCFNNLWRVNSSGGFNTSRNPHKKWTPAPIISRVERVGALLDHVQLQVCDTLTDERIWSATNIYLDPPYLGTFSAYAAGGFTPDDHRSMRDLCEELPADRRIVVSNSDNAEVHALYSDARWVKHLIARDNRVTCKGEAKGASVPELLMVRR